MNKALDTKTKILEAARRLFATHGFSATSVRDIASEAGVNVAAVNYHFDNKQNLFWQVFRSSMEDVERRILALQESRQLAPDALAAEIFFLLNDNWMEVRNTFRMMLSPELPEASGENGADFCQKRMGPPGAEALMSSFKQALGKDLSEEALVWGVRTLFSQIAHMALMINTDYVKKFVTPETCYMMSADFVAVCVKEQANAILARLRDHSDEVTAAIKACRSKE